MKKYRNTLFSLLLCIILVFSMCTACDISIFSPASSESSSSDDSISGDSSSGDSSSEDSSSGDSSSDDSSSEDSSSGGSSSDDSSSEDSSSGGSSSDILEEDEYSSIMFDATLMSFNIRTYTNDDTGVKSWTTRKTEVVSYINGQDATIICMQEVRKTQYEYLADTLDARYEIVWYGREDSSNPEGLAIAYDVTVWDKLEENMFWLSETPDVMSKGWSAQYYRICVNLLLEHKNTGEKLNVFDVHLENGSATEKENTRLNEMNLILERAAKKNCPVFVAGDFNCGATSSTYAATAEVLQDCKANAPDSTGSATYHNWGASASRIDFCFVSKTNMTPLKYQVWEDMWGENNENYYSDHYAIKTTVRITKVSKFPSTTGGGFDGDLDLV